VEDSPNFSDTIALEERLRSASDGIHLVVDQLKALEDQKRAVEPSDPRFIELAALVRESAESLAGLAQTEETFARELTGHRFDEALSAIEDVPARHDLAQILEEWRDVERRLEHAPPGSPEARELVARFEQLRAEYADALQGKSKAAGNSS
jgi:hypothetical protein